MVAAIKFGLDEGIKPILEMMEELRTKCGAPAVRMGELNTPSDEVMKKCKEAAYDRLVEARKIKSKKERNDAVDAIKGEVIKTHFSIPGCCRRRCRFPRRRCFDIDHAGCGGRACSCHTHCCSCRGIHASSHALSRQAGAVRHSVPRAALAV